MEAPEPGVPFSRHRPMIQSVRAEPVPIPMEMGGCAEQVVHALEGAVESSGAPLVEPRGGMAEIEGKEITIPIRVLRGRNRRGPGCLFP